MKLYTEEQVREAIAQGYDWCHQKYIPSDNMINVFIKELTPIELPSDEEIDIYVKSHNYDDMFENLLEYGAKWMRDKIINQNK